MRTGEVNIIVAAARNAASELIRCGGSAAQSAETIRDLARSIEAATNASIITQHLAELSVVTSDAQRLPQLSITSRTALNDLASCLPN